MALLEQELLPWNNKLCLEIALGIDDTETLLKRYDVRPREYEEWCKHPLFMRTIADYQQQARDSGMSFRLRARIQAEDLLSVSYKLAHNPDTPASVRADLIKWTAKMAELEPKQADGNTSEQLTQKAMAQMLEKMDDGELELSVMKVISKRKDVNTVDAEIISENNITKT